MKEEAFNFMQNNIILGGFPSSREIKTMTSKEFKIGNNIYFNNKHKDIGLVTGIVENILGGTRVYLNYRGDVTYKLEDLEAITLTDEILLGLGFTVLEAGVYDYAGYIRLVLEDGDWEDVSFDVFLRDNYIINVWEVHQLQNLILEIDRTIIKL